MERIIGPSNFLPERVFPFVENLTPSLGFKQDQETSSVIIAYEYRFSLDEYPEQATVIVPQEEFKSKIYRLIEGEEVIVFQNPHGNLSLQRGNDNEFKFSLSARNRNNNFVSISSVRIPGVVLDRIS